MYSICLTTDVRPSSILHECFNVKASKNQVIELVRGLQIEKRVVMQMTKNSGAISHYDLDTNNFTFPKKDAAGCLRTNPEIDIYLEAWGDMEDYQRVAGYLRYELQKISANQNQ